MTKHENYILLLGKAMDESNWPKLCFIVCVVDSG